MTTIGDDIGDGSGDQSQAAEYVLGLLNAEEHAAAARRIATDPAFAAEVRQWQSRFASLDNAFEERAAPPHLLADIEARVFGAPARPSGLRGLWENLNLWRGLAAAALAVAVVAIGINVMRPAALDPRDFATQLVAALEEEGSNVKFLALYDGATGTVRLTALSGDAAPDRDFELWAIEGDNAPVSMGVVPANARSEVTMKPDILAKFGEGSLLAITLEPKGGSPTGDPTGPVVAKGVATPI
jgi:anti-sigma-K factor RskA